MSLRIATVSFVLGLLLLSALTEAKKSKSHSKSGSHSHSEEEGPEDLDDEISVDYEDSPSPSNLDLSSSSDSESDSSTSEWKGLKHRKSRKGSHSQSGSHSHSESNSASKHGLEDDDFNGLEAGPEGKRGGHKPRGWFERWRGHKGRHHKGCMFHRHKLLVFHAIGGAVILALVAAVLMYRRRARRVAAIAYVAAPTVEVAESAMDETTAGEHTTVAVEVISEVALQKESAPVPTA